jgi:bacillaene synthase trans-acting acyltransferase
MPLSQLPKVFMFSGQGSQYFQMGKALFEGNVGFRHWMQKMDKIAEAQTSRSVLNELYDPRRQKSASFDRLALSHPAIFMVEYALARTLIDSSVRPDLVLGASLGTFAAAAIGGALSMEDALWAVQSQSQIIESSCPSGGMIAIMADSELHQQTSLGQYCEIAALNFPSHFVVASEARWLARIESLLGSLDVVYQCLPVSYPFHSQWMDRAQASCTDMHQHLHFKPASIPIICCAEREELKLLTSAALWNVVRQPVDFQQTIARLEAKGPHIYIDVGPSGTLATFLKYLLGRGAKARIHTIFSPYGRDAIALSAVEDALR